MSLELRHVVPFFAAAVLVACGVFGGGASDDDSEDPGPTSDGSTVKDSADAADEGGTGEPDAARPAPSVQCGSGRCDSPLVCCLGGDGEKCVETCDERPFYCDDSADCPDSKVCCLALQLVGGGGAGYLSATCSSREKCVAPDHRIMCDPKLDDCQGGDCVDLRAQRTELYPTRGPTFVCD